MTFVLYTILFVMLVFIWFFFDFHFGRKRHFRLAQKHESPLFKGNFEIFSHGNELFANYFQSLKGAQKSIEVQFYIVRNDSFSQEFLTILKKKATEGVSVRLLLDRIGCLRFSKKTIAELKEAGVQFRFASTVKFPFLFYSSQMRNHRKITVIDGAIGFLGGFNVGKEYIDFNPKLSPWRDYHLRLTGEGVPFLLDVFLRDWEDANVGSANRANAVKQATHEPVRHSARSKETIQEAATGISDPRKPQFAHRLLATEANLLEVSYLRQLGAAKKSIIIGTPYFIPSKRIAAELLKAVERGVKLTVIVPATADHLLVQEASFRYFRPLLKAGATIYQFKIGFYHAKTVIIDESICEIGTANFDKRSLFLNKEINCYFYEADFTKQLLKIIANDIDDSQQLSLQELNRLNPFRTVKEAIATAVSYFL